MRLQENLDAITAAGGVLLAISVDEPRESAELAAALAADGTPIRFPLACDPSRQGVKALGVHDSRNDIALPAVLILDDRGRVAYKHVAGNVMDRPDESAIVEALKGLPAAGRRRRNEAAGR